MAEQKSGQDVTAGAGRRDEVGKTGIYPATGPYPPGDVEVITPGEINSGETGEEVTEMDSDALGG